MSCSTVGCHCTLTRQDLRDAHVFAGGQCPECHHLFGQHPERGVTPRFYEATVHLKKQKATIRHFSNYDQLLVELQKIEKWRKVLRFYDFKILAKYSLEDKRELIPSEPLPSDLPNVLVIELLYRGFSDWKHREDEALTYVGSLFKRVDRLIRSNDQFPTDLPLDIDATHITLVIDQLKKELEVRMEAVNLDIPSELTCREFISPFLIASIRLVLAYLKSKSYSNKLSLVYEKYVFGLHASGPVDYIIMLDYFDIILTEAKKENAKDGIIQNLLQQYASLEFLSNILIDTDIVGVDRKRKFKETFDEIRLALPTFGIVSTGSEWIFTKCVGQDNPNERTKIYISKTISIHYDQNVDELEPTIRTIIKIISNMIIFQIEKVKDSQPIKKMKNFTDPVQLIRLETNEGKELRKEIEAFDDNKLEDDVISEVDEDLERY